MSAVAQNLFGCATHTWCNANLCSFKLFWEEMSTEGGKTSSSHDTKLHTSFPMDICTTHSYLKIEPDTIKYAMCTKCSSVYPPKPGSHIPEWQPECTACHFLDSPICSQPLVKSGERTRLRRGETPRDGGGKQQGIYMGNSSIYGHGYLIRNPPVAQPHHI